MIRLTKILLPCVDPAFDRQRLQQRYNSALSRAGMRRSRPRSYASCVRMANRTIWTARNRTFFRITGELSPSDFSIRIAGHIVTWTRRSSGHATSISDAQCYASHGPGRSSHVRSGHRWLMDSGANNHMVTEESDCTSDITPSSGFITGVSVDIVGQGNFEIFVTTSSGESIPATIYGVKITPDLATRTNGAFTRIFSVRQAVRNGCSVLFSPTENSLSLPDGTNIPLDSENGLYWLPFGFPTASDTPVAAPSPLVSKTLIHRRLCHLHDDGIRRLSAMKVPGIPHSGMFQALPFCHCCTTAKSTVADICRQSTRDHDPPTCFYMMAVDLWGPVDHAAIGGYKYVFGSICYLSGYHMAELLRTKDEAPGAWKRMLMRIRTLGFSVHVLRIDSDSVFLGAEFRAVCDDFGVDI